MEDGEGNGEWGEGVVKGSGQEGQTDGAGKHDRGPEE